MNVPFEQLSALELWKKEEREREKKKLLYVTLLEICSLLMCVVLIFLPPTHVCIICNYF